MRLEDTKLSQNKGEIICGFTRLKEMKKIKIKVIETRKIKTLEVKVKVMKITISFCTMV